MKNVWQSEHNASRDYTCRLCGQEISKRSKYLRLVWTHKNKMFVDREHLDCWIEEPELETPATHMCVVVLEEQFVLLCERDGSVHAKSKLVAVTKVTSGTGVLSPIEDTEDDNEEVPF